MAAAADSDIAHEFRFFRVHKDGSLVLFHPPADKFPTSDDPTADVRSKDVVISSDPPVSARIFLPKSADPTQKLPLLFYVHGGGFCMESAFSPRYHSYVSNVVAEAKVIAVSVEYGLFPARPACYDDSWAALQWVAAHANKTGPEAWLHQYADFSRVFVGGDSAGGNITHTLMAGVGSVGLPGVKVVGAVLVHPYFGGTDDDKMWLYMHPGNKGLEDPRLKPAAEDLGRLGCEKVLVFVAEKDHLMVVGKRYVEELKKSGWGGTVEIKENLGEHHCFHLDKPKCDKAVDLVKTIASFLNQV